VSERQETGWSKADADTISSPKSASLKGGSRGGSPPFKRIENAQEAVGDQIAKTITPRDVMVALSGAVGNDVRLRANG